MSEHSLENVRERLLRAGIGPRHVSRYVTELSDHMEDLVARERATGLDLRESEARSRIILGSDAQLTHALIDSGAPRSMAARVPWMVFGILPLITLVAVLRLLHAWSMVYFFPYRAFAEAGLPESVRATGLALTVFGNYVIGPALAATCIVIALRQRLSSHWVWVGLAVIALASGAFGVHIHFLAPEGGTSGGIRGSFALQVYEHGQIDVAATQIAIVARAIALFVFSALAYMVMKRRINVPLDAS